jgi:hypothetical protein
LLIQIRSTLVETNEVAPGLVETIDQVNASLQEFEPKLDTEIAGIAAAGASPLMPFASQHPVVSVLDDPPARFQLPALGLPVVKVLLVE